MPFTVRLAAAPVAARVSAAVQTVLKLAAYERSLESRVTFDVQGRPVYQLQMFLPDGLRLDRVSAPGEFQYAVTQQDKRPLLTIYLATGRQGDVPVLVRGKLGGEGELKELPLPRLEVLGVDRQQGDVAVQVDPAFDVDAADLKNCEPVLLGRLYGWLNPQQQQVTRLGLHYAQGDYAGTLRLTPRKPDVTCDTISNVRVTDRAIEETILLDFTIRNAGVRELSFLLPAGWPTAGSACPCCGRRRIEPVSKEAGAPLRVRIELQDEVMDQLRILVENDRLLTPGSHEAPIPAVELGRTNRRYVAIESAGRDEVVVEEDKLREMDALGRQQKEWETAQGHPRPGDDAGLPGGARRPAAAASVPHRVPRGRGDGEGPHRPGRDHAGARRQRGLSRPAGAARRQRHRAVPGDPAARGRRALDGPRGRRAGQADASCPARPIRAACGFRLIKTAPGDLSYEVVLKYGGKMPALGPLGSVAFPLLHCENIRPELSQVRLYVPEQYRWFDFGGTMRPVVEEADLQAGYVKFQTKQTEQLLDTLRQGDKFAQARAVRQHQSTK